MVRVSVTMAGPETQSLVCNAVQTAKLALAHRIHNAKHVILMLQYLLELHLVSENVPQLMHSTVRLNFDCLVTAHVPRDQILAQINVSREK